MELTLTGPALQFNTDCVIALAGARMAASLDGAAIPFLAPVAVAAGQTLAMGTIEGAGARCYLAVRHGFDAPDFLGSAATFALGGFGGHATGVLRTGDVLRLRGGGAQHPPDAMLAAEAGLLDTQWTIGVLLGPHGAPDFFTRGDIDTLFSAEYRVHHNSARTGVRLIGPKPEWARRDGGQAGLHPSNIHDNAYAVGALDFTGDMPIILGPDGPSLGGFVCPAVVTLDELWKIGQLRPGDRVRFVARDLADVTGLQALVPAAALPDGALPAGALPAGALPAGAWPAGALPDGVLRLGEGEIPVCIRVAGDDNVRVEYGAPVLDIALRLRVHSLIEALRQRRLPGIVDLTPGIRSLQVHNNPAILPLTRLLGELADIEVALPSTSDLEIPSRIVHLPLSWDDEQARLAMRKYQELVRPDAPWCPSNIEFIRRINGLDSTEDVRRIVFDASYLVLGLGDVYLGAPMATPLDPRHTLVTTKYNHARTWTPQNAVGIGGAYMCVYGMEGPGGYQLVGRSIQMWNAWRTTRDFAPGHPWLLRFFDQIRFFPVSAVELAEAREAFPYGRYPLRIENTVFSARDHAAFLAREAEGIAAFQHRRQAAFEAERQRWQTLNLDRPADDESAEPPQAADALPEGAVGIEAPVPGTVWTIDAKVGDIVQQGQTVLVLESMKMEMRITAPVAGRLTVLLCQQGGTVAGGQLLAILSTGALA